MMQFLRRALLSISDFQFTVPRNDIDEGFTTATELVASNEIGVWVMTVQTLFQRKFELHW